MGFLALKTGPSLVLKNWSKFFFAVFPQFYSVFWAFLETQIVQQCVKIVFLQNFGNVKNEVFEKKIAFFVFSFFMLEIEKQKRQKKKKREKAKKPYKNRVFFKVVIQKYEKSEKRIFLQKLPDTICVRKGEKNAHFRAHYLFWPKFFFGPKQCKAGKTIKIVVSADIGQNQK